MISTFRNDQGQLSGAKLVLLIACSLTTSWLVRDLWYGRELTEWHSVLLGVLLLVGLINRMSARGNFKMKFGNDGIHLESEGQKEINVEIQDERIS